MLYISSLEDDVPDVFVWRYVDLGSMDKDSLQWRRITKKDVRPRRMRNRTLFKEDPSPIEKVYGPLMELWTATLGIIYHYDRSSVPWLTQDALDEPKNEPENDFLLV